MQHHLTGLIEPAVGSAGDEWLSAHFWESVHQVDSHGKTVAHRICEGEITWEVYEAMQDIFPCLTPEEPLHMCTVQMQARGLVRAMQCFADA